MNRKSAAFMGGGIILLLLGYWFYGLARPGVMPSMALELGSESWMPAWMLANSPSFIHLLAFSCLAYAVLGAQARFRWPIIAVSLVLGVGFELSQLGLSQGTFDMGDIGAQLLAAAVFLVLTYRYSLKLSSQGMSLQAWLMLPLIAAGVLSTTASTYERDPYVPIYMSYEELRQPLTIDRDRPLGENGKIYLYQDYLFVNEPNKGIHVFDNADPTQPVAMYFINLPGNVDLSIRNNHIFADSFIDLVSIDISDINNPRVVSRQEDVFAYDPYQAIPDGIWMELKGQSYGVVIGYEERGVYR